VAYLKVLTQNLPRETKEKCKIPQDNGQDSKKVPPISSRAFMAVMFEVKVF